MFYLIVFGILAILSLMNLQFTDKLSRQMLMLPVVLMLIGIAGLRYETGGDWDVYTRLFLKFPDLESLRYNPLLIHNKHAEEGFILLCAIIKTLGGTIQTLFFVVTAFNITLIASVLPKYTKYPVLALLCYYCILYFNLEMIFIRQAIAVALCFYALQYISDRKPLRFILLVLLASCFHRVAVVLLPFWFVLDKKLPVWVYLTVIGVGAVIMATGVHWIKDIFVDISSLLGEKYADKAETYTTSNLFAVDRGISLGFILNLLILAAVMLFKRSIDEREHGTVHLNMFALSLALYYYCYELVEISNRFRLFFLISVIVVLPLLIEALPSFMNRLIGFVLTLVYCFSFASAIFLEKPQAIAYNPYQNYLEFKHNPRPSSGKQRLEKSHEYFRSERKH